MSSNDGGDPSQKKDENVVVEQAPSPMPFDVVVLAVSGGERNLSPDEFFALPLAERIEHVVKQRASFFASGQRVDAKTALAQIRRLRSHLH